MKSKVYNPIGPNSAVVTVVTVVKFALWRGWCACEIPSRPQKAGWKFSTYQKMALILNDYDQ